MCDAFQVAIAASIPLGKASRDSEEMEPQVRNAENPADESKETEVK